MRLFFLIVLIVAGGWASLALAAEAVSRLAAPRGQFLDIGGRKLRLVCEGPKAGRPVVWMESGAFSGAADFAAIQQKLAAKGVRSCAYDRAGMGYSDPAKGARDGDAIVGDLEKLVAASGETGPFVLAAHSMGGLYVRQYAARNPDKVAGLVLIDAVTPQMMTLPGAHRFWSRFQRLARMGAVAGSLGLTKPLYLLGDRIGLPPAGKAEKRRGFITGRQNRAALAEVLAWQAAAAQADAAGPLRPEWPVAVITAGDPNRRGGLWTQVRQAPAKGSIAGLIDNIPAASHTTMLGLTYGDPIVAGVEHVIAHAQREQATETP